MLNHSRLTFAAVLIAVGLTPIVTASVQAGDPDLKFVVDTLRAVHPNPHHRITARAFDEVVARLNEEWPGLSGATKALKLAELIARLEDGHTRLGLTPPVFARAQTFPIRIEQFVDGLFVIAVREQERALLGARINRINGQPWEQVWQKLAAISSGDNVWSQSSGLPVLLTMPEVVRGLGLGPLDVLQIDGVASGGGEITARVPAVTTAYSQMWHGRSLVGPAGATVGVMNNAAGTVDLAYRNPAAPYWFSNSDGLLYVQLNMLLNSDDPIPIGSVAKPLSLQAFWDAMLAALDADATQTLVIDLRYNGGGDNSYARRFVDSLVARPSINRKGKLFVVMGRRTYSAAMNFLSLLEERTSAIFVGEPAGGAPSHFGDPTTFTLPQSQLTLRISTMHWDLGVQPADVREVMEPSLPAPPRFSAFRDGKDPALDAVRAYRDGDLLSDRMLARFRQAGLAAAAQLFQQEHANTVGRPWGSAVQQLIAFGYALISHGATSKDIFGAFELATTTYPEAIEGWLAQGRVNAFVNRWRDAQAAYEKAAAIRPSHAVVARLLSAARLK